MAVKQRKDGSWQIESAADLEKAVALVEEREESRREVEQEMEEQYDYLTMGQEITDLNAAIKDFMAENDIKHVFRDTYKITMVRRWDTKWNLDKLRAVLPKNMLLKVTTMVVDPAKIDDLVRQGKLDSKKIEKALEQKPQRPFVQRYPYKEGQDANAARDEEMALRQQLSGEAVEAAPSPKKRKKS